MKEKTDKKHHAGKTGSNKEQENHNEKHGHPHEKHGHPHEKHDKTDKHHEKTDKHHDKTDKHHDKQALKGATMNASPAHSSHPVRHRTRSMSRKDTTHSLGHGSVKGHKEHEKGSVSSAEPVHHVEVKYENTYKMLPDYRFYESKVKDIMVNVFQENIADNLYDYQSMGQKCKLASEIIKEKVKSLNMQRFKIICHVLAAQKGEQSMVITSRCLWDQRFDNSATVTVKRGDYYVIGMVFAVYAE